MTNESAILGLLADLYHDKALLQVDNAQLRQQLATMTADVQRLEAEIAPLMEKVNDTTGG